MAPDMTLVVNGDDALSAFLAKDSGNKYVTFGIGKQCQQEKENAREIREGQFCKCCGEKLNYHFTITVSLGIMSVRTADLKDRSSILMLKT